VSERFLEPFFSGHALLDHSIIAVLIDLPIDYTKGAELLSAVLDVVWKGADGMDAR
jgi:hypothetical protein